MQTLATFIFIGLAQLCNCANAGRTEKQIFTSILLAMNILI